MKKEIYTDGKRFTYSEEGRGLPLLIICGWSFSSAFSFTRLQGLLADQGYRTIILNLPGFGGDIFPSFWWGMEDYHRYVTGFINEINLKEFYLLGHSFGGALAIKIAVTFPERVKALVLVSPGIFRGDPTTTEGILFTIGFRVVLIVERIRRLFFLSSGFLKKLNHFFSKEEKTMSKILEYISGTESTWRYLPEIKCPTITIWGERDYNYFLSANLMGRIVNKAFRIIPRTSHSLQKDDPESLAKLIVKFIDGLNLE